MAFSSLSALENGSTLQQMKLKSPVPHYEMARSVKRVKRVDEKGTHFRTRPTMQGASVFETAFILLRGDVAMHGLGVGGGLDGMLQFVCWLWVDAMIFLGWEGQMVLRQWFVVRRE